MDGRGRIAAALLARAGRVAAVLLARCAGRAAAPLAGVIRFRDFTFAPAAPRHLGANQV